MIVPVGSTRTIEFVADAAGDWLLHCHMPHHMMNQMGHAPPPMFGVRAKKLDRKIERLVPGYMTMGQTGMAEMSDPDAPMPIPPNSIPMLSTKGPFGLITVGGMSTIVKVWEGIAGDVDPGWYDHPPGMVAKPMTPEELRRDGIEVEPKPQEKKQGHEHGAPG